MRVTDVQRAIAEVCLAPSMSDARSSETLASLGGNPDAWLLHRELVRRRFHRLFANALPRTRAHLGNSHFDALATGFLARRRPQSRYLRLVVGELVDYALDLWHADEPRAYVTELAAYERLRWDLSDVAVDWPSDVAPFDFDAQPVLNPTLHQLTCRFPVHRPDDHTEASGPYHLALSRNPESHRVGCWALSPRVAALLRGWRSRSEPATATVWRAAAEQGLAVDRALIDRLAGALAELIENRIVLGSVLVSVTFEFDSNA